MTPTIPSEETPNHIALREPTRPLSRGRERPAPRCHPLPEGVTVAVSSLLMVLVAAAGTTNAGTARAKAQGPRGLPRRTGLTRLPAH